MAAGGSGPISGPAIGLATAGGLLLYAGLRDVSPVQAIRDVLSGRPPGVKATPYVASGASAGTGSATAGTSGGGHAQIYAAARRYLGVPYRWGGATPDGFDCSGLVTYVLVHDLGLHTLPSPSHTVTGQFLVWRGAVTVSGRPQAGDLVCWLGHIAIASGTGMMIEAPGAGKRVREVKLRSAGATIRRVILADLGTGVPDTRAPGTAF